MSRRACCNTLVWGCYSKCWDTWSIPHCSAMVACRVLVCCCTSCGQTTVLLQGTQAVCICVAARPEHTVGSVWLTCFQGQCWHRGLCYRHIQCRPLCRLLAVACADAGPVGCVRVGFFMWWCWMLLFCRAALLSLLVCRRVACWFSGAVALRCAG